MLKQGTAVLAAALAALAVAPGDAVAARSSSVVMYSDPGDYIGQGLPRWFDNHNGHVGASGSSRGGVTVGASGGPQDDYYSLEFAAPYGHKLKRGVYDHAMRWPFQVGKRAGMDVGGTGRGCNADVSRFEVRDVAYARHNRVRRLWVVFEQHCEYTDAPPLFGEVRIREPVRRGVTFEPTIVRWPPDDRGAAGNTEPVTIRAARAVTFRHASIGGRAAGDYAIRADDCSGRSLRSGESCQVWVRLVRGGGAGTRLATLHLTDDKGRRHDAALQTYTYGGVTKVVLHKDDGRDFSYTPDNATIRGHGTRQGVAISAQNADADSWTGTFLPGNGDILAPGDYQGPVCNEEGTNRPCLIVEGNRAGCRETDGSWHVTDARFESGGRLRGFGVTFEQHCADGEPTLRGELDYRAGDHTRPAPWMAGGRH